MKIELMDICACVWLCVCICVRICVCVCVCIHTCVCVCVFICVTISIHVMTPQKKTPNTWFSNFSQPAQETTKLLLLLKWQDVVLDFVLIRRGKLIERKLICSLYFHVFIYLVLSRLLLTYFIFIFIHIHISYISYIYILTCVYISLYQYHSSFRISFLSQIFIIPEFITHQMSPAPS